MQVGDNSPWRLIGNYCKHFNQSEEYVLWKLSWANFTMNLASIPKYSTKSKKKEKAIDAADLDKYL